MFARDKIANGVHSGSGRTEVISDNTDYYPIALTREAIRPGTIYADPYGHLFIIADWIPQGVGTYGVLVGADAQPDGTIGRRRFWPGSFLFTPDTTEAAGGFKAFRPAKYYGGRTRQLRNADISGYSLEQYKGTKDAFYDKVEALINPRPLDPNAMLEVLVTALHEQVKRRVVSVQNAIDYKAKRSGRIKMPTGHAIFETTGAWENYSTPSRDMRLLIAMDTVLGFPAAVKRNPARFGITGRRRCGGHGAEDASHRRPHRTEVRLCADRWKEDRADPQGCGRSRHRLRDGVQPERLCGNPLGRAGSQPRALHMQDAGAKTPARAHGRLSLLVCVTKTSGSLSGNRLLDCGEPLPGRRRQPADFA